MNVSVSRCVCVCVCHVVTSSRVRVCGRQLDAEGSCVNFTLERWFPVANMSRYLSMRVYDYYAPERYNETIFDALPTYLLNICEVCGSSQCPYCAIYNAAAALLAMPIVFIATIVTLLAYLSPGVFLNVS
ncbi:hypothetical protein ACJJTC_005188 [Scirpophaga incertulas]